MREWANAFDTERCTIAVSTAWTASDHLAINWFSIPVLVALIPCLRRFSHDAVRSAEIATRAVSSAT